VGGGVLAPTPHPPIPNPHEYKIIFFLIK